MADRLRQGPEGCPRSDGLQLLMVANQNDLGPARLRLTDKARQLPATHHARLIDDEHILRPKCSASVLPATLPGGECPAGNPMLTWNGARHGALQLFGHVHDNWPGSRNSINVGVDVWDFLPMRVEDIRRRAETFPVNPCWNQVEPGAPL